MESSRKVIVYLITLCSALAGGALFSLLHLPIPWLLGPMLTSLVGSNIVKKYYSWPGQMRNAGMIIVGYTIGLSLTGAALKGMVRELPAMLMMTVLLLLFCAGIALVVSKLSGMNYRTILLGSIPGGLTQMLVLAEETEDINLTVVTVIQVVRLIMIIVCVPLLIFSPLFGNSSGADGIPLLSVTSAAWSGLFPNILFFALACMMCGILGQKIKFPTAYLLGPAIITAILQFSGLHGPALPSTIINVAQLMIGIYVGLLLDPRKLNQKLLTISLAIGSGIVLIAGSWGISSLFSYIENVSASTALLSLAPGGMDQMSLIAHEVNADLSTVAGYQLFRTFFIFFAVPPLFKLLFTRSIKKKRIKLT